MQIYFIILIVLLSSVYIFLYIKKMLTRGEENPKCANCALLKNDIHFKNR